MGQDPLNNVSNTHRDKQTGHRTTGVGPRSGNDDRGSPKDTLNSELGFKLFIRWSLDIEEGEDAGNVEEKGPSRKGPSGTLSVGGVAGVTQYRWGDRL